MAAAMGDGIPSRPEDRNRSITVRIDQLDQGRNKAHKDHSPITAVVLENEAGKLN